jgi:hypothetical protein
VVVFHEWMKDLDVDLLQSDSKLTAAIVQRVAHNRVATPAHQKRLSHCVLAHCCIAVPTEHSYFQRALRAAPQNLPRFHRCDGGLATGGSGLHHRHGMSLPAAAAAPREYNPGRPATRNHSVRPRLGRQAGLTARRCGSGW